MILWETHQIPLRGAIDDGVISKDAYETGGQVFQDFILTLLNEETNDIETNFDDQDEAYECYQNFVMGYCKTPGKN